MSSDAGSIPAASTSTFFERKEKLFCIKRRRIPFILPLLFFILCVQGFSQDQAILRLSAEDHTDHSRVIIESSTPLQVSVDKKGSFLHVEIKADHMFRLQREPFRSQFIKTLSWAMGKDFYTLSIKVQHSDFIVDAFAVENPPRIVIDIRPRASAGAARKAGPPAVAPTIEENDEGSGGSSSSQASGQKCIVIDPGHGGLENGAKGKFGSMEKNITLAIGLKLKEIIEKRLAFNVVLTRESDVDVSLEKRASIANNNQALLFVSIHANSSYRKDASGSETFFLSLNATDEEARRLAYLENNSEVLDRSIVSGSEDDIKMILWDMAQTAYIRESSHLAERIQQELNVLLGTANRGIKQAPFKVLTGVACPAVLVEVAFISNPEEERKMLSDRFQHNVAEAIYRGMLNYIRRYSQD
jgi:N-acetylmuramoyl-L-alanine amidase